MKNIIVLILLVFTWSACNDLVNVKDVEFEGEGKSYAFPILNSGLTMVDLGNGINEQTYIEVLTDGKLVVHYDGEISRKDASSVFPSFPIVDPVSFQPVFWPIPDTNYQLSLELITNLFAEDGGIIIKKSIYKNNGLTFVFTNQFNEDLIVTVTMPGMTKDGKDFKEIFSIPANASNYFTDKISIDKWTLEADNFIPFVYDARTADGERVVMETVLVNMDSYSVTYTEGYFGQNRFDLEADEIDIGVFKKWKSGGFAFNDPTITLEVDNSFGFPVRAKIDYINFTTISDTKVELGGQIIDDNINFNYPSISERGKIVNTFVTFDKDNSNVKELFNDKVKKFSYNIDASANPTGDTTIIGFIDSSSFFKINASVILPLEMTINDLVLVDSFHLDLKKQSDKIKSAQFKLVNQNSMPFDISLQCYFLDEKAVAVDSLFGDKPLFMNAAIIDGQGEIVPADEITTIIEMDELRYNKLKTAKKIAIEVRMKTNNNTEESVWIREDHGLLTKLGVIVDVEL